MSKELIEQLAEQFTQPIEVRHSDDEIGDFHTEYSFDIDQLEAFAKAYQANINDVDADELERLKDCDAHLESITSWLNDRGLYWQGDYSEDDGPDFADILTTHEYELMKPSKEVRSKIAELEAQVKAYQAAAPIDNVLAEALGKAAQVCDEEAKDLRTFSEPFGANVAEACAEKIRALIPTQANRTEG
jgi:hypothetical protein